MSHVSGGTLSGVLRLSAPAPTPVVSAANEGRIYYDSGAQRFMVSENGGAYVGLGHQTLAQVLSEGNVSGANNILMTAGQQIDTATAAVLNLGNTNATALGIGTPSGTTSTFQVFINQGGASFNSNAGLQLSSTTSNRGSGRFNQFGANAGVPGITGFKSRGTNVGDLVSVADGDILARMTAIGVAADNASIPLAGFVDIRVPTGGTAGANWVATDFSVSLVPLAGPINSNRQVSRITSEAAFELIDGTTAAVSPASKGQLRYNNTTKTFQQSVDGGTWTDIATSVSTTWASVLAAGNTTGATNPVLTSGQTFRGEDVATGGAMAIRGGNSSGVGVAGGAASLSGGAGGGGNATGGALNLLGGIGSGTASGGNTLIRGGTGSASGGSLTAAGGPAGGGNSAGGQATFAGGSGSGSGSGGTVFVSGGTAGATGAGGAVGLTGGTGGATSGSGGVVAIAGGDAPTSGTGGSVTLAGGTGATAGGALVLSTATTTVLAERVRVANHGATYFGDGTLNLATFVGTGAQQPITVYRDDVSLVNNVSFGAAVNPAYVLMRSRGTAASPTGVAQNDTLGSLSWQGIISAVVGAGNFAAISAAVDGATVSNGDTPGRLLFSTTPDGSGSLVERMRIDSGGTVFVGDGTAGAWAAGPIPIYTLLTYRDSRNLISPYAFSATATDQSEFVFARGRGTAASPAAVTNGDSIGQVSFAGFSSTTNGTYGATIRAEVDGSVSTNILPGRVIVGTTPAGSGTPVERLRVNNLGTTLLGDGTLSESTWTDATYALTAYRSGTACNVSAMGFNTTAGAGTNVYIARGRGTSTTPAAVQNGDQIGRVAFMGVTDATNWGQAVQLVAEAAENFTTSSIASRLRVVIGVTGSATPVERMRIETNGRVGVATTGPTSTFDTDGSLGAGDVSSVSTNTTLDDTHSVVLVDASGGAITITLPAVSGITRRRYTIKKIDSSANAVTIDGNGAETIDGATTQSLAAQYDSLEVVTNGTEWFVV